MTAIGKLIETILRHYEKKEYDPAEKAADELIALHPDFPQGNFMKAVILEETGRTGEAEKYYAKAGNKFTLWFRLAMQLQEVDPDRALLYYERVSGMDPRNNMIWFNMGNLYEKLGKLDQARSSFMRLDPFRELLSRILIPLGFTIFLASGAVMMVRRGETGLTALMVASAIFCLFWLKRDGGKAINMAMKKNKYR